MESTLENKAQESTNDIENIVLHINNNIDAHHLYSGKISRR